MTTLKVIINEIEAPDDFYGYDGIVVEVYPYEGFETGMHTIDIKEFTESGDLKKHKKLTVICDEDTKVNMINVNWDTV